MKIYFIRLYKSNFFLSLVILLTSIHLKAQLIIDTLMTPAQLVQEVLLGNGVSASNFTFNGLPATTLNNQAGYFDATNSNTGIANGVILATEDVTFLTDTTFFWDPVDTNIVNDPDLLLLGNPPCLDTEYSKRYNNIAILEFDFVPNGDSLAFNYVFASQEYGSFTCTQFNDVFGFFISGPGINGPYSNNAENIALIPGTTTAVGINTVNSGLADGDESQCEAANPNWLNDTIYFAEEYDYLELEENEQYMNIDGFTNVLTAIAIVECGETYHIKLAIGDACDSGVNSAVFLEAESFSSNTPVVVDVDISVGLNDSTLYDGCGSAELTFTRESDPAFEETIYLSVGGTAINGVDYIPALPDSITYAAGDSAVTLTIDAVLDAIEGIETIEVEVTNNAAACSGGGVSSFIIYIDEAEPLTLVTSTYAMVDCNDTVLIAGLIGGGYGNYNYNWSNGINDSSQVVSPGTTTTYFLTLSDTCDAGSITQPVLVTVPVYPPLVANAGADITLSSCFDVGILNGTAQGGLAPYLYSWTIETVAGDEISDIPEATYSPNATSNLAFTIEDQCQIQATDYVTINVLTPPISITTSSDTVICTGTSIDIWANATGGQGELTHQWNEINRTSDTISISPTANTTYTVTYTDECQTSESKTVIVQVNQVTADFGFGYLDYYGVELSNNSTPDNLNYNWNFDGEDFSTVENPTYFFNDLVDYQITLTATDSIGCTDSIDYTVTPPLNVFIPTSFTPNGDGINDLFAIEGIDILEFELRIFNRWGEIVFESYDKDKTWNGTGPKGEHYTNSEVFVYQLKVLGNRLQIIEKTGTITVVK
jgi:gliding motility-associated-like protein